MNSIHSSVIHVLNILHQHLIIAPLRELFFKGPKLLGFWNSMAEEDICSRISGVPADFWHINKDACRDIAQKEFHALYIGIYSLLYFLTLFLLVRKLLECPWKKRETQLVVIQGTGAEIRK